MSARVNFLHAGFISLFWSKYPEPRDNPSQLNLFNFKLACSARIYGQERNAESLFMVGR